MKKPYSGRKADAWSLGVVFYVLMFGSYPFSGADSAQVEYNVLHSPLKIPLRATKEEMFIINLLLSKDPDRRITPSHLKTMIKINV